MARHQYRFYILLSIWCSLTLAFFNQAYTSYTNARTIDIQSEGEQFTTDSTELEHFTILHTQRSFLLIGARNAVYNISVADFTVTKAISWPASEQRQQQCEKLAVSECQNFIRVMALLPDGRWVVCGTNAYSPMCLLYEQKSDNYLLNISTPFSGFGMTPFSPKHGSASLLNKDYLYAGTPTNVRGSQPVLQKRRATGTQDSDYLQTDDYDEMLESSEFVGSFETENHIYMIARETPKSSSCSSSQRDDVLRARVMRVCKLDKGVSATTNYRNQNKWTSFVKVRLNCSLPGDYPFYFDQIVAVGRPIGGVYFKAPQIPANVIYVVVNTPYSGIRASAICGFRISDIDSQFENGQFVGANGDVPAERPGRCVPDSTKLSEDAIAFTQHHPLVDGAVNNFFERPLVVHTENVKHGEHASSGLFTVVDVDPQVKAADGMSYDVLFTGTENGQVHKIINTLSDVRSSAVNPSFIAETLQVLPPTEAITGIYLQRPHVFVVSARAIRRISIHRCDLAGTCQACINMRDPYCAWSKSQKACVAGSNQGIWYPIGDYLQDVLNGTHSECHYDVEESPPVMAEPVNVGATNDSRLDSIDLSTNTIDDTTHTRDRNSIVTPPSTYSKSSVNCIEAADQASAIAIAVAATFFAAILIGNICGICLWRKLQHRKAASSRTSVTSSPLPSASINTSATSMTSTKPLNQPKEKLTRSASHCQRPIQAYDNPAMVSGTRITLDAQGLNDETFDNFATLPKDYRYSKQVYL